MRRVRELLRLHYGTGASARAIACELGVSRSTVKEYLARAAAADLARPLPDDLTGERAGRQPDRAYRWRGLGRLDRVVRRKR
jgi:transposase